MKIGIVWEHGVSKWTMAPFEGLSKNHDVTVFVGQKNKYDTSDVLLKKQALSKKEEFWCAVKNPRLAMKYLRAPYKRFYFYLLSLSQYITDDFDVIICHDGSRSLSSLTELKKIKPFKLVVSYAENIPFRSIYDDKTNVIKKRSWKCIDLLVPWCKTVEEALLEEGVNKMIRTIPMGVSHEIFRPLPKDTELCKRYGLDTSKFTFSYIGKLVSWKGVQHLLYAANVLRRRGVTNFQISITGKGAQLENLKKIISDAELDDYVVFTGSLPYREVGRLYSITDCLVLPSVPTITWQEQFGMVLVEAMSCRKPILAANSGSIPEVSQGACLLHTPGSWRELARDMEALMNDASLYENLAEAGYRRALAEYSDKRTSTLYEDALLELFPVA
ncbi:MAG: glycosyltransferase family 4 protein [Sulfuricellaceae bacterium]|nr:glycosyltransferase family 4 protein [Sulfuricellaceae bacterium]